MESTSPGARAKISLSSDPDAPSMSDIFISYKREEQPIARKLADALEKEGWSVWWDPKLRRVNTSMT
jgi:TIR domain